MRYGRLLAPLLAAVLLVAACASPEATQVTLRWSGSAIEGRRFYERQWENLTIFYTRPTNPKQVEEIGKAAAYTVDKLVQEQRMARTDRLQIWVVPTGEPWPAGALPPVAARQARALGPGQVMVREEAVRTAFSELTGPLALAALQREGDQAFAIDWLHEGMAEVLARGWGYFPGFHWRKGGDPLSATLQLEALADPRSAEQDGYRTAAAALVTLAMDRWGVNWLAQYPRRAEELTPESVLLWSTGTDDRLTALARWQERINYAVRQDAQRLGMAGAVGQMWNPYAADISPVRLEPKLPALPVGAGPNENYSPHSYVIDARYEPLQRLVEGTLQLTWQNGEGIPVDTLYFNLWPNAEQYARSGGGITVREVSVDQKPAAFTALGLDLAVPLGRVAAPGESATVEVRFSTRVPLTPTGRVFGQRGIQQFHLAHWFPILAVLDDRGWQLHPLPTSPGEPYSETAQYLVRMNVPAQTVMGATGELHSRREEGERWVYEWNAPNVRDWVTTGGQGLIEEVREVEGITLRVIYSDPEWIKQTADVTAKTIPLFNEAFGPYAWKELVVTCCSGLEYPGFFFTTELDARGWWQAVIYHELAHQWFYGIIGNDQYMEPWMDEGFARYGERLGVRTFGPAAMLGDYSALPALPEPVRVSSPSSLYAIHGSYALGVYNKGALALENLEALLGRQQFRTLMHEWYRRYQFKVATTADFIRVAEEVSGRNLDQFFRTHEIYPEDRAPYRPIQPLGEPEPRAAH